MTTVMVDGEQHGAALARRRTQPHGGATAVRADLQERETWHGATCIDRRIEQRITLVRWHESLRSERVCAQRGIEAHHWSQWMMLSAAGRAAGRKSVPLVKATGVMHACCT